MPEPDQPTPAASPGATESLQTGSVSWPASAVLSLPLPEELQAMLPKGAYVVERLIGRGGMGAVYKGWQISLERHVA